MHKFIRAMPLFSSESCVKLQRRKFLISLIVAMLMLLLFIFVIHTSNAKDIGRNQFQRNENLDLKLVHVVGV